MSEYIEVFRVEAKSLLKNFQQNEKEAIARCAKVFGDRKDLSLMNMQHVVAKEYGFGNWNELAKADRPQQAAALIAAKNKTLRTPLHIDYRAGSTYAFGEEKEKVGLRSEREGLDLINFKTTFMGGTISPFLQLNMLDVSSYDLSKMNPLFAIYDDYTRWPAEMSKLPEGFNPLAFMEERKNPGLGVRALHRQGLDGRGRAAAIIDGFLLCDHLEYHENLKGYERIDDGNGGHGSIGGALVSALAGKNCGVAPKAEVYYFSASQAVQGNRSQRYYAQALLKICDLHQRLKQEGKSGIDVVCILWGIPHELFKNDDGAAEMLEAIKQATELGIWVNSGTLPFSNKLWRDLRIHCKFGGDVDNPDDYMLMPTERNYPAEHRELERNNLCCPAGGRTVADEHRLDSYQFSAFGFYLKPYESGLFLLARSVKPDVTAEEFWRVGLETGDYREGIGMIVNPRRLIAALQG